MDKKIALLSVLIGTALFILIFPCQIFFRVYPSVNNSIKLIYKYDTIFIIAYFILVSLLLIFQKRTYKILLYLILPIILYTVFFIYEATKENSPVKIFSLADYMVGYYFMGLWPINVFCSFIDFVATYFLRRKPVK